MSQGSITISGRSIAITEADERRFWAKVDKAGNGGCWQWTAALMGPGYGNFRIAGGNMSAHRLSWVLAGNSLERDLQIDHMCHNRACVNPSHLRQVVKAVNGQNRAGVPQNNSSGARGVSWDSQTGRWRVMVTKDGRKYRGSRHASVSSAELEAITMRVQLGMANAVDVARLAQIHGQTGATGVRV